METNGNLAALLSTARGLAAEAQQQLARVERDSHQLGEIIRLLGISSAISGYVQLPPVLGKELVVTSEEEFLCGMLRVLIKRLRQSLATLETLRLSAHGRR